MAPFDATVSVQEQLDWVKLALAERSNVLEAADTLQKSGV